MRDVAGPCVSLVVFLAAMAAVGAGAGAGVYRAWLVVVLFWVLAWSLLEVVVSGVGFGDVVVVVGTGFAVVVVVLVVAVTAGSSAGIW